MRTPLPLTQVLDSALGRAHRDDATLPRTGGPAGNAQLTAWFGLSLLALFLAELVTLLDINGLLSWHIAVGLLLIPPALAKTATTGWRILRYYRGSAAYVEVGPPPLLLRLLGPLVIVGTLAVLGSGALLIALGPTRTFAPWLTVVGQGISPLTLHQASFVGWAVVTGLHVLARLVPAFQLATGRPGTGRTDGARLRTSAVLLTAVVAAAVTSVVLGLSSSWTDGPGRQLQDDTPQSQGPAPHR